jgi:curved DNA-binding protein CbpA
MTDLYEALGVDKNTPTPEIRKAYRRASKKAHPDGGGSVDKFALVKLAMDTLGDDERRARYDRTGQAEESSPDNTEGNARQTAFQAVETVIAFVIQRGLNYEEVDIIADALKGLQNKLVEIEKAVHDAEKKYARAVKIAIRIRAKPGRPDILGPMMAVRIAAFKDAIRQQGAAHPVVERAIEIISDHSYDYTAEAAVYLQRAGVGWLGCMAAAMPD